MDNVIDSNTSDLKCGDILQLEVGTVCHNIGELAIVAFVIPGDPNTVGVYYETDPSHSIITLRNNFRIVNINLLNSLIKK